MRIEPPIEFLVEIPLAREAVLGAEQAPKEPSSEPKGFRAIGYKAANFAGRQSFPDCDILRYFDGFFDFLRYYWAHFGRSSA